MPSCECIHLHATRPEGASCGKLPLVPAYTSSQAPCHRSMRCDGAIWSGPPVTSWGLRYHLATPAWGIGMRAPHLLALKEAVVAHQHVRYAARLERLLQRRVRHLAGQLEAPAALPPVWATQAAHTCMLVCVYTYTCMCARGAGLWWLLCHCLHHSSGQASTRSVAKRCIRP